MDWSRKLQSSPNTLIETTKATKRNLISDDLEQLSVKLVISVDSKSTDLSGAGNWCFETETEETTNQYVNIISHHTSLGVLLQNDEIR